MCVKLPCAQNYTMCTKYHVCLTTFLNGIVIMQDAQEKADLQKTKVNATKIRKVRVDGINFVLGKNGGRMPSSLGTRLIVVIRHAGTQACMHVGRYSGRQAHTQAHMHAHMHACRQMKYLQYTKF